jgi:hypothetical protein
VSGFSRIREVNVTQPVRELLSQKSRAFETECKPTERLASRCVWFIRRLVPWRRSLVVFCEFSILTARQFLVNLSRFSS